MKKQAIFISSITTALLLTACFPRQVPAPAPSTELGGTASFSAASVGLEFLSAQTYKHDFTSTHAGTVAYDNGCELANGETDQVVAGANSKTIKTTKMEFYQNCSFIVTDDSNNAFDELSIAYIKYDEDGVKLSNQALSQEWGVDSKWDCVEDLKTGVIWEVKEANGGLRDKHWRYGWGNNSGIEPCHESLTACKANSYVAAVNTMSKQLCGKNDWRMPTKGELISLVTDTEHSGVTDNYINKAIFPNNKAKGIGVYEEIRYWSSTDFSNPAYAWSTNFTYPVTDGIVKDSAAYVRLVRDKE